MTDNILLLSPAIATGNRGDEIIMEAIQQELNYIIDTHFTFTLPTHTSSFHWYQVLRNSSALRTYSECKLKFACGSNLLIKDMLTHYPQWNINIFNYQPFKGTILVGVGASAHEYTNWYTKLLYKKMLNPDYIHSVRDERTRKYVESLGLKALNTGCATMWMLTSEFCKTIPTKKSSRVVFTLTPNSTHHSEDQLLIDTLVKNYQEINFWVQGRKDMEYLKTFTNINDINIVKPTLQDYTTLLKTSDLDYVGTRLHAGIYAMRHRHRSIIIVVDERAREINKSNNLVCLEYDKLSSELESLINSEFKTEIQLDVDAIHTWKAQFT